LLGFARTESEARRKFIPSRRQGGRQFEAQRNSLLLAGHDGDLFAVGHCLGQAEGPLTVARHGFAGVVDDDGLFLDGFAGEEIVVLAGESIWLAA
jgi:hypothetical protein